MSHPATHIEESQTETSPKPKNAPPVRVSADGEAQAPAKRSPGEQHVAGLATLIGVPTPAGFFGIRPGTEKSAKS